MQSTVSYFIHDAWVAASTFECPSPPDSLAFCCSTCGEIWARAWVEAEPYQFRVVPCARHRPTGVADISAMPGSILNPLVSKHFVGTGGWANVIEHLPWAVLARELELHITAKELEWQTYPQQM
jgi:hypothetical protein